ncbi:MAG TPA: CBS domain-containing protein, partial [Candidatus Bathyarchaeia archaeon]|nr:CBS domain-containing protein [Candidatus Bathyarchaeia archaeon]
MVPIKFARSNDRQNKQKLNLTYTMIKHVQRQQLEAEDIKREVITLERDKTLYNVRKILFRYNISRVVMAKHNKPLGIVTEKDIAWYLYTEIPNRRLDEVTVEEVTIKDLITVGEYA